MKHFLKLIFICNFEKCQVTRQRIRPEEPRHRGYLSSNAEGIASDTILDRILKLTESKLQTGKLQWHPGRMINLKFISALIAVN